MQLNTLQKTKLDLSAFENIEFKNMFENTNELISQSINQMNLYDSEKKVMLMHAKDAAYEIARNNPQIFKVNLAEQSLDNSLKTKETSLTSTKTEELANNRVVKRGTLIDNVVNIAIKTAIKDRDETLSSSLVNPKADTATVIKTGTLIKDDIAVKNDVALDSENKLKTDVKTGLLIEPKMDVKKATLVDNKTSNVVNLKDHAKNKTETKFATLSKKDFKTTFEKNFLDFKKQPKKLLAKKPKASKNIDLSKEVFIRMISERLMQHEGVKANVATYDIASKFIMPRWDSIKASIENSVDDEFNIQEASIEPKSQSISAPVDKPLMISRDMNNVNPIDSLGVSQWETLEADKDTRFQRVVNTNKRHTKLNLPKPTF